MYVKSYRRRTSYAIPPPPSSPRLLNRRPTYTPHHAPQPPPKSKSLANQLRALRRWQRADLDASRRLRRLLRRAGTIWSSEGEDGALLAGRYGVGDDGDAGELAAEGSAVVAGREEEFGRRGEVDAFGFCRQTSWVEGWDADCRDAG